MSIRMGCDYVVGNQLIRHYNDFRLSIHDGTRNIISFDGGRFQQHLVFQVKRNKDLNTICVTSLNGSLSRSDENHYKGYIIDFAKDYIINSNSVMNTRDCQLEDDDYETKTNMCSYC